MKNFYITNFESELVDLVFKVISTNENLNDPSLLESLQELQVCLDKNNQRLNEYLITHENKQSGSVNILNAIYTNLKAYTDWYAEVQHLLDAQDSETSNVAYSIVVLIEGTIIPNLEINCPSVAIIENGGPDLEKLSEGINGNTDKDIMWANIKGSTEKEKEANFRAFLRCVKTLGGKKVALYIKAAIQLGYLAERPQFKHLVKYFGVIGGEPAISNYYNSNDDNLHNAVELEKAKENLKAFKLEYSK